MVVSFHRRGRCCSWTAVRPPRSVVPGPTMAAGGDLPHDLYTFVIEDALDLAHGFWGCVADGATFRTLGRKQPPQGRAVNARHLDDLDAWLDRWRAVPDGGDLTVEWSTDRSPRARTARSRPVTRR